MKKPTLAKLGIGRRREAVTIATTDLVRVRPLNAGSALPLLVEPALEGVDLLAWAAANREKIQGWKLENGGILFRGFSVNVAGFETFIEIVSGKALEYKERSSPRSRISGNIYTSTDYPHNQHIFLHNENSYQHTWPLDIYFFCDIEPTAGGETPIGDCRRIMAQIPQRIRDKFAEKGIMYMRNFNNRLGLPWRQVFGTGDRDEVREHCHAKGLSCEWLDGDHLRTRATRPLVKRHPVCGAEIWFNHATFFHVSTLPDILREALIGELGEENLPTNTYYGDGSAIEPETLDLLRALYLREKVLFPWRKNDILFLDNMLTAHGREPYGCERRILVGMANAYSLIKEH